jgi:GTP:adenosylcobinamide-phosphate guanylyltransferase
MAAILGFGILTMISSTPQFTTVVLAGDRRAQDPLLTATGARCKALIPIGGRPMVVRVLDALTQSRSTGPVILCGPPWEEVRLNPTLSERIASGDVKWVKNEDTPCRSVLQALRTDGLKTPVLVTTADHALLSAHLIDHFCAEAIKRPADVVVGLAPHELVMSKFPETRRTALRLRDGVFCSCNLFAFMSQQAWKAPEFWQRMEHKRKKPMRLVWAVGPATLLNFLMGRLSLPAALQRVSDKIGLRADAVVLPFPEAAVDVDTPHDLEIVRRFLDEPLSKYDGLARG